MGSFAQRTRELEQLVGDGLLVGRVSYSPEKIAVPQHAGTWRSGPLAGVHIRHWTTPGTGPDYLGAPLLEGADRFMQQIADTVLRGGPRIGMERAVGELHAESDRRIPRETGRLAESGDAEVNG